jgi:hypothetical protein
MKGQRRATDEQISKQEVIFAKDEQIDVSTG